MRSRAKGHSGRRMDDPGVHGVTTLAANGRTYSRWNGAGPEVRSNTQSLRIPAQHRLHRGRLRPSVAAQRQPLPFPFEKRTVVHGHVFVADQ